MATRSASLRARRDELETAIVKLREKKSKLKEDDYYQQLEKLLVEFATLSEVKKSSPSP